MTRASPPLPGLRRLRHAIGPGLATALFFSAASSVLMLGVPLYSMQLFDRVVPTGHRETLLLLSAALVLVVIVWGILEGLRSARLARLAMRLADRIGTEIIATAAAEGFSAGKALREFDQVRHTVSGPAMQAMAELPWLPVGLVVLMALHPILGLATLASAGVLLLLGWLNHAAVHHRMAAAHELAGEAIQRGEAISRHADLVRAMGMLPSLLQHFRAAQRPAIVLQQQAGEAGWLARCARAGFWSSP